MDSEGNLEKETTELVETQTDTFSDKTWTEFPRLTIFHDNLADIPPVLMRFLIKGEYAQRNLDEIRRYQSSLHLLKKRCEFIMPTLHFQEGIMTRKSIKGWHSDFEEADRFAKYKDQKDFDMILIGSPAFEQHHPLQTWIANHSHHTHFTDPTEALEIYQYQIAILRGLVDGVKFLHQNGIIHGELNSNNLVFQWNNAQKYCLPVQIIHTGFGPKFVAPEWKSGDVLTKEGDLYAMGFLIRTIAFLVNPDKHGRTYSWSRSPFVMMGYGDMEHPILINAGNLVKSLVSEDIQERITQMEDVNIEISEEISQLPNSAVRAVQLTRDHDFFKNIKIEQELGRGGYGVVFQAQNIKVGLQSAVKILQPLGPGQVLSSVTPLLSEKEDLVDEFRKCEFLYHPNIVRLFQFAFMQASRQELASFFPEDSEEETIERLKPVGDLEYELPCLEMELCGLSLRSWLDDGKIDAIEKSRLYIAQIRIIHGIIEGMKFLHYKDILHRDLNPNNVFFSGGRYEFPVKVGDFGLSQILFATVPNSKDNTQGRTDNYSLTEGIGTFAYRAPEISDGHYGKQADIFSLGLTIWEVAQRINVSKRRQLFDTLVNHGDHSVVDNHPLIYKIKERIIQMTKKDPQQRIKEIQDIKWRNTVGPIVVHSEPGELFTLLQTVEKGSSLKLTKGIFESSLPFKVTSKNISIIGEEIEETIIKGIMEISNGCTLANFSIGHTHGDDALRLAGDANSVTNLKVTSKRFGISVGGNENVLSKVTIVTEHMGLRVSGIRHKFKNVEILSATYGAFFTRRSTNCDVISIRIVDSRQALTISGEGHTFKNIYLVLQKRREGAHDGIVFQDDASNCNVEIEVWEGYVKEGDVHLRCDDKSGNSRVDLGNTNAVIINHGRNMEIISPNGRYIEKDDYPRSWGCGS